MVREVHARPRFQVDFNELLEADLVLLSRDDVKVSDDGEAIELKEGLPVSIYDLDLDGEGRPDNLVATGVAERNRATGWASHVKWCCRIDSNGIRHESDIK